MHSRPPTDTALVGATPPATVAALFDWIVAHPKQFTMPIPNEGTAFESGALLRLFFGAVCGPYSDFQGPFNSALYAARVPPLWLKLASLSPYLWTTPAGQLPKTGDMDELFANGTIAFTFSCASSPPQPNPKLRSFAPSVHG